MVKLSSEPSLNDLDRIQDLFPVDDLYLYDSDPLSPRFKSPTRKRSTPTSRLQRALSGKNKIVPTEKNGERVEHHSDVINKSAHDSSKSLLQFQHGHCGRRYVMEAPVQLVSGVQSQERHLFLLTDLLIVAKPRASGVYKLKEKVRVAELWLSKSCAPEVVCEVAKNTGDTAFVLGWPTTNLLVNFSSTHTRDLWLAKLKQLISVEQEKGPDSTSIRVHHWDANTKEEYAHNVCVSRKDTVLDCMSNALVQLGISADDVGSYQLWVKSERDTAPYPLIGHESPLAIKMNCLFTALAVTGEDAFDLDYCRNISNCPALKCYFILRTTKTASFDLVPSKKGKRVKRSPILPKVFRRSLSKPDLSESSTNNRTSCQLFGQPLEKLLHDGSLPKALLTMLYKLYETGPYTVGIFRKSANARVCRELREKLNFNAEEVSGAEELSNVNIFVLAVLMKDFLRSLPDCLLMCQLYLEWLTIPCLSSDAQRINEAKRLVSRLPPCNEVFLKHFMCVLWHVQKRSAENMMTAANLAVCVGPSLLWAKEIPSFSEQTEASKQVPSLVQFLISNCRKVFGEECLALLNHTKPRDVSRQDSGNEESESQHSMQSSHSSGELRRDDSSLDSLERALLGDGEHSPKLPPKSKMSLTNLSRDSGLTMSDTQLYTPDEESLPEVAPRVTSSPRRSLPPDSFVGGSHVSPVRGGTSQRPRSTNCFDSKTDTGYWPPTHYKGNHYDYMRSLIQSSGLDEGSSSAPKSSSFPLGARKEVTKRRLSRSRPLRREAGAPATYYATVSEFPLRRSASDESVLSFAGGSSCSGNHWPPRHPSSHPRNNRTLTLNDASRSKSVLRLPETEMTSIFTYDSSTLSDDDSTPRVSRNNSRSNKEENAQARQQNEFLYSNVYATRTINSNNKVETEIHHASPITIDMSDEELEARPLHLAPPPLPPKPRRFLSTPYDPPEENFDWNPSARQRPPPQHPTTSVISVGGQRVLTSNANNLYDVPPWRPAPTNQQQRTGRSATISRSSHNHHRAKSQPAPIQRDRQNGSGFQTLSGNYDKNPWKYNNGMGGGGSGSGTMGRSLKKEISWSVSQLKAFFSRTGSKEAHDQQSVLTYRNYAPLPPPPYRPPPSHLLEEEEARLRRNPGGVAPSRNQGPPWGGQSAPRRNRQCKYMSSSESQESVSGGEESYV